jgi:hypothetical protein
VESHYRVTGSTRLKLAFGARRMRCEVCRCNFASFRLRRAWYRRPEPPALGPDQIVGQETREAASER